MRLVLQQPCSEHFTSQEVLTKDIVTDKLVLLIAYEVLKCGILRDFPTQSHCQQ